MRPVVTHTSALAMFAIRTITQRRESNPAAELLLHQMALWRGSYEARTNTDLNRTLLAPANPNQDLRIGLIDASFTGGAGFQSLTFQVRLHF